MEFLIPTLRVAKELEWNGHELSERIDQLEKLDETRLCAVAGMYALKRHQKQFFDTKVISKEFQEGDLVLSYTLKQHSTKLSKHGKGPFVIHSLSPSGAVKLAGEPMANRISGCRLKKYHLPLTKTMLDDLHLAKTNKQKREDRKNQAQEEARIQREEQKLRRASVPPVLQVASIGHG